MVTPEDLIKAYDKLECWNNKGDFSKQNWEEYKRVAALIQHTPDAIVERSIKDFIKIVVQRDFQGNDEESKLFVLLRILFDIPEKGPIVERRSFKGWTNWPKADLQGDVNLLWPVVWNNGEPYLEAKYEGSEGIPYNAVAEFEYFKSKYGFREIEENES